MPDFLSSPIFFAAIGGFLIAYVFQIFLKGPKNEQLQAANEEYVARLSTDERASIEEAIAGNRKIEAVKYFRAATNVGLKEAKEAVEYMARQKK